MGLSRDAIILGALALLGASSIVEAQTEPRAGSMKNPKERAAMTAEVAADKAAEKPEAAGASKQKKLSMCLETWDAQTHMTKQEWRVACLRSVRDYPDAFDR